MKKRHWLLVAVGCVLLLGAGVSAAFFMSHRRDVTTTSEAAYQAYREGVANETRFYFKEARLAYAKALELDPSFAMAMLGLARQSKDDDQRARPPPARREGEGPADGAGAPARRDGARAEREAPGRRHEDRRRDPSEVSDRRALGADAGRPRVRLRPHGQGDQDLRGAPDERPQQRRCVQPDGVLLRLSRGLRQGRRSLQALSVHRPGHREPLRLARRGPGLLGPLQRGPREPQPRARDQARFRRIRRAHRRGPRGHGRVSRGDQAVRARRRDDGPSGHAARVHHAGRARRLLPGRQGRGSTALLQGEGREDGEQVRRDRHGLHRSGSGAVRGAAEGHDPDRPGDPPQARCARPEGEHPEGLEAALPGGQRPDGPGARSGGQVRRGPGVLEEERESAEPVRKLRGAPGDLRGPGARGRGPRPQGRPRRRREADRREPQVERELGAHAGARRRRWPSCGATKVLAASK